MNQQIQGHACISIFTVGCFPGPVLVFKIVFLVRNAMITFTTELQCVSAAGSSQWSPTTRAAAAAAATTSAHRQYWTG
jgi:hypothetical protein